MRHVKKVSCEIPAKALSFQELQDNPPTSVLDIVLLIVDLIKC